MEKAVSKIRKLNSAITNRIIELQNLGYFYDFIVIGKQKFVCLQDNYCFLRHDISIKLIDQVYDQLHQCYKYIHAIETSTGHKGLLLEKGICIN